ncbi:MAG: glycosyltransferase, partial [Verrucomicrobiales bacterium]
ILAFREVLSATGCPVVGLDFNDAMTISDTALKVLERSCSYFKRELPADIQQLLPRSASPAQRSILEKNAHKLMPASLGLSDDRIVNLPRDEHEKKHDVFFSGDASSEVRRRELHLMDELSARGVRVSRPESRLSQQEFFQSCSESYLVWSPEGAGWDCFRHYESAGCGSVPLMNAPCIRPYMPFVHGQHALYYLSDFGNKSARCTEFQDITDGLVSTVTRALEDRQKLQEMGRAARGFVLRHHTHEAIVTHIVRTAEVQSLSGISPT